MDIFETGVRIKNIRKMRKLTQEQLAEKVNVTPHYIYEIERGYKTMSIYTLASIAYALNAPLDYIIFGKEAAPEQETEDFAVKDDLDKLIETIPLTKRDNVSNVLKGLLPYIK